jgi:histidinol-phosphate/aromatic aminotransferase/cobyric acid decarboxylase-like protein
MQAIILAAGMGKRLGALTANNTKCMVKVNGVTLIERMLGQLDRRKLSRIVVVTGYEGKKLKDYIDELNLRTPICFIDNPVYDKTNNIYSLSLAKDYLLSEDTLLFESDIIFEDMMIDDLMNDTRPTLALVDKYESWMDGTCIRVDKDDNILQFISGKKIKYQEKVDYYKTVNTYKCSINFSRKIYVPFLEAYRNALGENEYYEQVLKVITVLDNPEIHALRVNGRKWYEIDDIQDLDIAETLFCEDPSEKYHMITSRYGGYWRYPDLLDFCYLVNPYFPQKHMVEEMMASFSDLLRDYPSGMGVNRLLASKNFNIPKENILVGNGAAELIRSIADYVKAEKCCRVGIVSPTFEEYPNRFFKDKCVFYDTSANGYRYNADDLIEYFEGKRITSLVLINPDNPTGNYVKKDDVLKLVSWTKSEKIQFIYDESFLDFAEESDASLIDTDFIRENRHVMIIKSISKSYGVPGLRLGILVCGNENVIDACLKDVSIWNINSIAEFYLQIYGKYKNDYAESLVQIKEERSRFVKKLSEISGIKVFPSEANYVMVELPEGVSAENVAVYLLNKHNILVKELWKKTGEDRYLRIAVRDACDNERLVESLEGLLGS